MKSFVIVAVARITYFSWGMYFNIYARVNEFKWDKSSLFTFVISSMIDSSNNLSASSSTKYFTFSKYPYNSSDFEIISNDLPGVPTIIWGILSSSYDYLLKSIPPTKVATLRFKELPKIVNCSDICIASSLFAVNITANTPWGSLASSYKIGKANVAVLPLPVSALANEIILIIIMPNTK